MLTKRLRRNTLRYVVLTPMLVVGISLGLATLHFTSVPADSGQAIGAGADPQEEAALELYTQPRASAAPRAQKAQIPQHIEPFALDSKIRENNGAEALTAFHGVVRSPGAPWLRLRFSDHNLGKSSYITITSLLDGDRQRLDAEALKIWQNSSAFFNGDAVDVELTVAPGDKGIFVKIQQIIAGEWVDKNKPRRLSPNTLISGLKDMEPELGERYVRLSLRDYPTAQTRTAPDGLGQEEFMRHDLAGVGVGFLQNRNAAARSYALNVPNPNICGPTDDRVASTDPAVGRIIGIQDCTGWLISNGAGLGAGHCQETGQVLQFNVPASLADGTIVNPPSEDQYPITYTAFTIIFDPDVTGPGNDWAVLRIGANADGETAIERQGAYYRMTRDQIPTTVRETGFGVDGPAPFFGGNLFDFNADNRTQQTDTGPFVSETVVGPNDVEIRYEVDDQKLSTGSPVIDTLNNVAIGIATHGGCTANGGENSGTGFENDNLENAIQTFPATNTVYVDRLHPVIPISEDGTVFRPFSTVIEGINAATAGATISIVEGPYNESMTISKAVTLEAPVGTVTIGP